MKLTAIKVNPAAIEQGQWIGDLPDMGDLKLKVRGIGNSDYRILQGKLLRAVPRAQRAELTPEQQDEIAGKLLLETCLIDWQNVTDEASAEIPYSKELAADLLFKPEFARFRDAVAYAAATVGDQAADEQKADEKN